ncbi:hypothetical protein UTI89_C1937 [Escherichia coli UTI89]|uniref:Uncharacterized protein n=1 Tax=Escherichia coli (strain UTI89 / UPEC) TaxID=364106 RepID=Q1RB51_ECOUT|nr:hypothetical protein UTI89_C1937 [Escherichia coli UTI89]
MAERLFSSCRHFTFCRWTFCQTLLKISIKLLFLFRRQDVVNLVLGFHVRQHVSFALFFHFCDLRFSFCFIEGIAGNDVMHCAAFFQRRTFHLVTLAFDDFADLLFLRVGQVQVFEHHVLMRTELAFMVHHRLRVSRCCGSGVCGMGQVSRAKSQGRGNKQCS